VDSQYCSSIIALHIISYYLAIMKAAGAHGPADTEQEGYACPISSTSIPWAWRRRSPIASPSWPTERSRSSVPDRTGRPGRGRLTPPSYKRQRARRAPSPRLLSPPTPLLASRFPHTDTAPTVTSRLVTILARAGETELAG
jgi:hypothetical protein